MVRKARLDETEVGLRPEGEGWYVLNAGAAAWKRNDQFGSFCDFEGERSFEQFGINIHVLEAGQPGCFYHRESQQEDFLVLHGECTLIVEGQERQLGQWDFFHCPPETEHVFIGAGDRPCAILMVGARGPSARLTYPVNDLARSYGASVTKETDSPREAYADTPRSEDTASPWPLNG